MKRQVKQTAGQAQARSTLRRYGVLDDRVAFVKGYFNETLRRVSSRRRPNSLLFVSLPPAMGTTAAAAKVEGAAASLPPDPVAGVAQAEAAAACVLGP